MLNLYSNQPSLNFTLLADINSLSLSFPSFFYGRHTTGYNFIIIMTIYEKNKLVLQFFATAKFGLSSKEWQNLVLEMFFFFFFFLLIFVMPYTQFSERLIKNS